MPKWAEQSLDVFSSSEAQFSLLLEVGAFAAGITLTRAEICFIIKPLLHEAVQAQKAKRIYVPGRQHTVRVITLYMKASVEELVVKIHWSAEEQQVLVSGNPVVRRNSQPSMACGIRAKLTQNKVLWMRMRACRIRTY